ncbi:MAG: CHAP domain-containing protein [Rhodospirillaceae bacterium]
MLRLVVRLSIFLVSLSIFTISSPSDVRAQMCVRYARMLTSFDIRGDAWTWWQGAAGRYQRGIRPVAGSILVFKRTGHLHYGHVSTVSSIINRRTILVDHSWLEGDVLHRNMKVIDTSPNNSWSSVRVWYEPSDHLGLRTYPTFGFIYPRGTRGFDAPIAVASADEGDDVAAAPGTSSAVNTPRSRSNALRQPGPVRLASIFLPHRKPVPGGSKAPVPTTVAIRITPETATVVGYAAPRKPTANTVRVAAVTDVPQVAVPRRKPGSTTPASSAPASTSGAVRTAELSAAPDAQAVHPRHKPGSHRTQVAEIRAARDTEIGD